jgi:hypothetical protein
MEGIITSLIFDHALRIRLTSGVTHKANEGNSETNITGDASGTRSDGTTTREISESTAIAVGEEAPKGEPVNKEQQVEAHNAGKVLDLVTADLDNVGAGREFLCAGESYFDITPCHC